MIVATNRAANGPAIGLPQRVALVWSLALYSRTQRCARAGWDALGGRACGAPKGSRTTAISRHGRQLLRRTQARLGHSSTRPPSRKTGLSRHSGCRLGNNRCLIERTIIRAGLSDDPRRSARCWVRGISRTTLSLCEHTLTARVRCKEQSAQWATQTALSAPVLFHTQLSRPRAGPACPAQPRQRHPLLTKVMSLRISNLPKVMGLCTLVAAAPQTYSGKPTTAFRAHQPIVGPFPPFE